MPCSAIALSAEEIREQISHLPDWEVKENALERVYQPDSYLEGLEKLNAIARLSEAENHHPEMTLAWGKLTIRYWTHTAHGITAMDFQLAQKAEASLSA